MIDTGILLRPIASVLHDFPYAGDFFTAAGIAGFSAEREFSVQAYLNELDEDLLQDVGGTPAELAGNFVLFLNRMEGLKHQVQTVGESPSRAAKTNWAKKKPPP